MRKVRICLEELATYEFDMEVPDGISAEALADLADEHFQKIGVAACQCEVQARELASVDGDRV